MKKCDRQLKDNKFYEKLDSTQTIDTSARILLGRLLKGKEIDSDTYKYLGYSFKIPKLAVITYYQKLTLLSQWTSNKFNLFRQWKSNRK